MRSAKASSKAPKKKRFPSTIVVRWEEDAGDGYYITEEGFGAHAVNGEAREVAEYTLSRVCTVTSTTNVVVK